MIIAPDATPEALEILARRKDVRVLLAGTLPDPAGAGMTLKSVAGGYLFQSRDNGHVNEGDLKVVTRRAPTDKELADLLFAFTVCKHVKSNAIVYAKDGATVGVGAGQMNRRDSSRIAALRAAESGEIAKLRRAPRSAAWWRRTPSSPSPTACWPPPKRAPPPSSSPAARCATRK